jgi:uncharacterized Zn finger protein
MNCPKCSGVIEPWCWQGEGGYKGVRCSACGTAWWSKAMVKFHEVVDPAVRAAEAKVIEEVDFPADAESDDDWRARVQASVRARLKDR